MTIWIDAQLSPAIADWIENSFNVEAFALRDLGLRDAEDEEIFLAAKKSDAVVITKDDDFLLLLDRFGSPPKIILADLRKHFKRQSQNHPVENLAAGDRFAEQWRRNS